MNVMIMATKDCLHYRSLSNELDAIGIAHEVIFCDDEPVLVQKYGLRDSINLIVNGVVVFRKQPAKGELRRFFNHLESLS